MPQHHEILVIGASGQLGRELLKAPWPDRFVPRSVARTELDLASRESIEAAFAEFKPVLVVNAAAYTNVDRAEVNYDAAQRINCDGPVFLAKICGAANVPLIHVSTDYVFDGKARRPYRESDQPNPVNRYGASKAAAEREIPRQTPYATILRTSWLFSPHRQNFVRKILTAAVSNPHLRVVDDQMGSPTCAADLARAIVGIIPRCADLDQSAFGLFHLAGAGEATWFDLAAAALECLPASLREKCTLTRISTEEFSSPAARPKYSVLDSGLAASRLGTVMKPWRDTLRACVARMNGSEGT
jgi:dTDP-4-dehydrorhamnose reductase